MTGCNILAVFVRSFVGGKKVRMRIRENLDFFSLLLLLSFFSPFLVSFSSTLYPLSIHWKSLGLSPLKILEMEL